MKWGSPVAKQFNVRSLPGFHLYDKDGKLVKQGRAALQDVLNWKSRKR